MSSAETPFPLSQAQPIFETGVNIIGAGIIGLYNALQFAKRGLRVTLIDNSSVNLLALWEEFRSLRGRFRAIASHFRSWLYKPSYDQMPFKALPSRCPLQAA